MRKSPLFIILLTVFTALVGFGIVIPLLPVYAERFGANGFVIGLLMMTYSLMQFILSPIAGKISDRIGRKPIIVFSLFLTSISYFVLGMAPNLTILFLSRILAGIGGSDITVAQAYIADVTDRENRSRGMGLFGAAFGFGFMVGPLLGGILAPLGAGIPAYVAGGFSGVIAIYALFALPEPKKRQVIKTESLKPPKSISSGFLLIVLLHFLVVFIQGQMQTMIVVFNIEHFSWAEKENGLFLGLTGLISVLVQGGFLNILTRKLGEVKIIKIGILFLGIGMYLVARVGDVSLLIIGGILNAMGIASVLPSLASLASLRTDQNVQGKALGFYQSAGSLGRILAPVTGGLLFDKISPNAPFLSGSVIALLLTIYIWKVLK